MTGSEQAPKILIGSDSPEWCTFRDGNPEGTTVTPIPGDDDDDPRDAPGGEQPGTTTGGGDDDDPRDAPGGGGGEQPGTTTGGGDDPRDVPRGGTVVPGDDPRDAPDEGDDPRDAPDEGDDPRDAPDEGDDPRDVPIKIYVKATSKAASATATALAGQQVKLFTEATTDVALPSGNADKPQADHDKDPIQGVTDANGNVELTATAGAVGAGVVAAGKSFTANIDTTAESSLVVQQSSTAQSQGQQGALPESLSRYATDTVSVAGQQYTVLTIPKDQEKSVTALLTALGLTFDTNYCRIKELPPNDPLYTGNRAWRQSYDNQWAIKRIGLDAGKKSAWRMLGDSPQPVTIAVIDTGLDWNHLDFDWDNLWRNPGEIPDNGIDDDNNGYIDDVIGWNFFGRNNKPWDHDGHGTIVAGIIAADSDNDIGISGINPHARIMVLKAINAFGHSRASYLAKAIVYAVDNGARVINMSVGGPEITEVERQAIDYAVSRGVLIVVASGNSALDTKEYGIAGMEQVLTVGATGLQDEHAAFSNWGGAVDIAAPGIEVLSLRARRTDTMLDIPGVEYEHGANYVGEDRRYYRASGTSFAAPIVSAVASLVLSKWPQLDAAQVRQLLLQSAQDVEVPGVDQLTGYGLVDARAALSSDPDFYITGGIDGVEVVQVNATTYIRVKGSYDADRLRGAWLELGQGEAPGKWEKVSARLAGRRLHEALADIEAKQFIGSSVWTIRLIVEHKNGKRRESRFVLNLG